MKDQKDDKNQTQKFVNSHNSEERIDNHHMVCFFCEAAVSVTYTVRKPLNTSWVMSSGYGGITKRHNLPK